MTDRRWWTRLKARSSTLRSKVDLRRWWNKPTAITLIGLLLAGQVSIGWAGIAKSAPIVITAVVGLIAYYVPKSQQGEARKRTEDAIELFVVLQDASEYQRNVVIARMRRSAPQARYSSDEISAFLTDHEEGRRYAGIASVQWQWQRGASDGEIGYEVQQITPPFGDAKRHGWLMRFLGHPNPERSTKYFPQLLALLCKPERKYEHYHVILAVWGMSASNCLAKADSDELYKRVCDGVDCQPPIEHQSEHWDSFRTYICAKRPGET